MTIVLGTFGYPAKPFCIYSLPQPYFCLQEVMTVFCVSNNERFYQTCKALYQQWPTQFIKHKRNDRILIANRVCLEIARQLGLYCLAELCKLTIDEIVRGQLADPLLGTIECQGWQQTIQEISLEDENHIQQQDYETCKGHEWIFVNDKQTQEDSHSLPIIVKKRYKSKQPSQPLFKNPTTAILYQWLSTDLFCGDLSMARQQQAIIETRQRRLSFNNAPININRKSNYKRKYFHLTASSSGMCYDESNSSSSNSSNSSSNSSNSSNSSSNNNSRNLHLLATQATQLIQQHNKKPRLPSLKTMLSGLKHHY
ncbi:MAG: hypothetical protein EXX96DRAFT_575684 [Benjaminiella poitrasii]|nr:MAG: hypothetical protein EXX96DRAFT_575684 [Benjaminiella poitrasii]